MRARIGIRRSRKPEPTSHNPLRQGFAGQEATQAKASGSRSLLSGTRFLLCSESFRRRPEAMADTSQEQVAGPSFAWLRRAQQGRREVIRLRSIRQGLWQAWLTATDRPVNGGQLVKLDGGVTSLHEDASPRPVPRSEIGRAREGRRTAGERLS